MNGNRPVLCVLSGAGLSAESGVPTFRSAGGIWDTNVLDRVCNAMTWTNHRTEVFDFHSARRKEMGGVEPNDAHRRLAAWQEKWGSDRVNLLTQNVDRHVHKMQRNIEPHDALLVIGSSMQVVRLEQFMSPQRRHSLLNWQVNPEPAEQEAYALNLAMGAIKGTAELETKVEEILGAP